jgi:exosortase
MPAIEQNLKGRKNRSKLWMTLALLIPIAVLGSHALASLFRLAFSNPEYSHVLLVPPIALGFLLLDRHEQQIERTSGAKATGVIFAMAAVGMALVSRATPSGLELTTQIAAIVLAAWAIVTMVYGWSIFRSALFPMLFLLLLIPWPPEAVEKLTELLQSGSTSAAFWFFRMAGVPVAREGFVLSLRSMDIEVAKQCSGIRSTVMLFVTAVVLGQWYLRSPWRKMLLAVLVFPIGILRNGLRIFILSVLGTYVDEGWLDGNLHHRGGAVFFVLGLATIALVLWLLELDETASRRNTGTSSNNGTLHEGNAP